MSTRRTPEARIAHLEGQAALARQNAEERAEKAMRSADSMLRLALSYASSARVPIIVDKISAALAALNDETEKPA